MKFYAAALAFIGALSFNAAHAKTYRIEPGPQAQAELAGAFAALKPGDRIQLEKGRYEFTAGIAGNVTDFSLRGAGADRTVLSFGRQTAPGDCLTLSGSKIELRNFAVENCRGDAIKTRKASLVSFRDLRAEWANGAGAGPNTGSGIAPDETQNALIDNVIVRGAPYAGLRVSQSQNVVVQNSTFAQNTLGAAIENSAGVDFMRNTVTHNAVGVAVSDLPGKAQAGNGVRLVKNLITANDGANKAPEGSFAASAPAGTGVLISAARGVAVSDNDIAENGSVNLLLLAFRGDPGADARFNALPRDILVTGNRFGRSGFAPGGDLKALAAQNIKLPDILWDGADTYFAGNSPRQEPVLIALSDNKGAAPGQPSFLNLGLITAGSDYGDAQPSATPPPLSNVPAPAPVKLPGGL